VGAYDSNPLRAQKVLDSLELPIAPDTNLERLIADTRPDIAFVCSTTAEHPRVVETLARGGVHMIVEKPMADSNAAAESMVESAIRAGVVLAMNWPLAWVPSHRTCRRLVAEGALSSFRQSTFELENDLLRRAHFGLLGPKGKSRTKEVRSEGTR
jgi:predicted dehydrogenase